ncbi:hypothetical protein D0T84_04660 [Dysgonomonas sp. 521]|uniref:hypothetical protein n=1 Tax=Dysgonomonas sp. 521 TaxID=2302932 RepID=UPI0013D13935|nr:hypothetical protein [Dysgonomonas sp. 521]NDV94210.1 hypothetical protein [Dysgonomonas sp. 521]
MMKHLLLFVCVLFFFSCSSDDAEFVNVSSTAEKWVQDNILPCYKKAAIKYDVPTNQSLRLALKNDCYVKQKFEGNLALEYKARYNQRTLDLWQNYYIIGSEIKNLTSTNDAMVTNLSRLAYIRNQNIALSICSDKALKRVQEIRPSLFYIYRVYISLDKNDYNSIEYSEIAIDIILDNEMNILNSEADLPRSTENVPVDLPEKEE